VAWLRGLDWAAPRGLLFQFKIEKQGQRQRTGVSAPHELWYCGLLRELITVGLWDNLLAAPGRLVMRRIVRMVALGIAVCFAFCFALSAPVFGQASDSDPATKEDVVGYLHTMRSHDMFEKMMEMQTQSIQKVLYDQVQQDKGEIPTNFQARMKKSMDELIKGMPADEIIQAMIPSYQKHFTRSDIQAMNAFYSSPVGQKVLQELPEVTQEGMQAALPIISKYLSDWKKRMEQEMKDPDKSSTKTAPDNVVKE
jgi:hypothetical protein